MTPLDQARATLDGFAPDCFQDFHLPAFSRENVEYILQAHELRIRKQVLLEAALTAWSIGMSEHNRAIGMPCDAREVGSAVAKELRRKADDLEGGKG